MKPIHCIFSGEVSEAHRSMRGFFVLPWVQGLLVSGYCPYTLWYILRSSTCPMLLGISQNNSFVGRLQGIWILKISEAMTFRPSRSGRFLHESLLCKVYDVKDPNSLCTTLWIHVLCMDSFELPVTEGWRQLRLINQYIAQREATTHIASCGPHHRDQLSTQIYLILSVRLWARL